MNNDEKTEEMELILEFKEDVTTSKIDSVLRTFHGRLNDLNISPTMRYRLFHITNECMENIYRHSNDINCSGDKTIVPELCVKRINNSFVIELRNAIENTNITTVTTKLDTINSLDKDNLKILHKKTLQETTISEKGGAGLGLISIAKSSGNKIDYRFEVIDDEISCFVMKVNVESI